MITFDTASPAQKRWVDAVLTVLPNLAKTGVITGKDCYYAHMQLLKNRKADSARIGYPNWLFKTNKIRPGVYFFPAKGLNKETVIKSAQLSNLKNTLSAMPTKAVNSEDDKKFFSDLATNGINVNTRAQVS
jgi:hypothetical protein